MFIIVPKLSDWTEIHVIPKKFKTKFVGASISVLYNKILNHPFLTKCFGTAWGQNRLSYFASARNKTFQMCWFSDLGTFHLLSPSLSPLSLPLYFSSSRVFTISFFVPFFFTSLFNCFLCVLHLSHSPLVSFWYDIFVNYNCVVTRWQKYSTHLHTNNT